MIFLKFFLLGSLTSLIYPPFFFLPLGFLTFPYLINLIKKTSIKNSFIELFSYGFFFGLGFLIIYLSWIHNPFLINENTKAYSILAILLPVFLSIFFGLGFCIYKYFKNLAFLILITPLIFILIEFLISNFLYGFPWITNSLILSNNSFGVYLIKYFGTFTSGYIIILIFLLPSLLYYKTHILNYKKFILLIYLPFIFFLFVALINPIFYKNNLSKEIKIELYQLVSPINKLNKNEIENDIIYKINNSDSEYIFFAENNYPYIIDKKNHIKISKLIKGNKKIIIGATTFEDDNYYNSFILLEKNKIHYFDKKILVPFGEFLPFRNYLNFMEYIAGSIDFNTGSVDRIIKTKESLKILPIICYEIIFDEIFNNIDKKEIDILVNITNDSWFGNKIGPYQHFYITRIKSLIANKPLVRVSNNGISAIIDNNGKILKNTKLNQVTKLNYNLKIHNSKSYVNFHKFFKYYLFFIFLLLFIYRERILNEK